MQARDTSPEPQRASLEPFTPQRQMVPRQDSLHDGGMMLVTSVSREGSTPIFREVTPPNELVLSPHNVRSSYALRPDVAAPGNSPARRLTQESDATQPPEAIPYNTDFRQLRLKALHFTWEPSTAIAMLALVVAVTIPLGVFVLRAADDTETLRVPYHHINNYTYLTGAGITNFTDPLGEVSAAQGTQTRVIFTLTEEIPAPVHMYYELREFHQAFRQLANSRNDQQAHGHAPSLSSTLMIACKPFLKAGGNLKKSSDRSRPLIVDGKAMTYADMVYNPCGAMPWSMFNDTFLLYRLLNGTDPVSPWPGSVPAAVLLCNTSDFDATGGRLTLSAAQNPCHKVGIEAPGDSGSRRYRAAVSSPTQWRRNYPGNTSDPFLRAGWYPDEAGHSLPDPLDLDFRVWMRVSPLSTMRKHLRKLEVGLPAGTYLLVVNEYFDVHSFKGEKAIVFRHSSWMGDSNRHLGVTFLVLGSLAGIVAIAFAVHFRAILTGRRARRLTLRGSTGVSPFRTPSASIGA